MGAGKFTPGGNRRNKPAEPAVPEPIRAVEPETKKAGGLFPGAKSRFSKNVDSRTKPGIIGMSVVFCVLFISTGWYYLAVRPAKRQAAAVAAELAKSKKEVEALKQKEVEAQKAAEKKAAEARAIVKLDSKPSKAKVTIGSVTKIAPAAFEGLMPGKATLSVSVEGYRPVSRELTLEAGQVYDLGLIELTPKTGSIKLSSPQQGATYLLTGPHDATHSGTIPATLDKLSEGTYTLTVSHKGWLLPPATLTVSDNQEIAQESKFGYATITLNTTPPGALVRRGRQEIGKTPLVLSELRPGLYKYAFELEGYRATRTEVEVKEFATPVISINLEKTQDFTNNSGMPLVWIPDGYWVGKTEVTQNQFDQIMGRTNNPSVFRGANRPVENVSWQQAMDFCARLTEVEQAAGKLPAGYKYTLPTEAQWNVYVADSSYDTSILALDNIPPTSTADVGSTDPNKFGLYDVIGNVWEWCFDNFDTTGRAHVIRGGGWLSTRDTFPTKATRNGGLSTYHDKFTGFRVALSKVN